MDSNNDRSAAATTASKESHTACQVQYADGAPKRVHPVVIAGLLFFIFVLMKWPLESLMLSPLNTHHYDSEGKVSKRIDLHYRASKRSWRGSSALGTHPFCQHDGLYSSPSMAATLNK